MLRSVIGKTIGLIGVAYLLTHICVAGTYFEEYAAPGLGNGWITLLVHVAIALVMIFFGAFLAEGKGKTERQLRRLPHATIAKKRSIH